MNLTFTCIPINIQQRLPLPANPVSIAELPDGGCLINFRDQPDVIRLDHQLKEIWRKDLQAQSTNYVSCRMTASPDGSKIALCGSTDLRITDINGEVLHQVSYEPWGHFSGSDCHFSADGRYAWFIMPGVGRCAVLQVMQLSDFTIINTIEMEEGGECQYTFHVAPGHHQLIIEASAGQEEAVLYQVQLKERHILLDELNQCPDRLMGSFAPGGKEFVTAPHYEEGIIVYSFPDITQVATLEQKDLFAGRTEYPAEDEDSLHYRVFYLDEETLLAPTRFGRLLLIDRKTMHCYGELLLEGNLIQAYDEAGRPTVNNKEVVDYAGELVELMLNRSGHLLATHNSGELRLYHLPEHFTKQ